MTTINKDHIHDDKVNPRGAFAYKSYGEIAEDICSVLTDHDVFIERYSIYVQIKDIPELLALNL